MKPALVYYGGKQIMLPYILPLIPDHKCYLEPFFGGGATFFAKKKVSIELINDNDDNLVNFYKVLQHKKKSKKLIKMCKKTLYARTEHRRAIQLFKTGNEIEKAWALWYKITTGFSGKLNGGFSTTNTINSSPGVKFTNNKNRLQLISKRLESIQIENIDALDFIKKYDKEDCFFYLDPPYMHADQGHYKGYTENDFSILLSVLSNIKGKFLLSCYPDLVVELFIIRNNWSSITIKDRIRAANKNQSPDCKREKEEMLIWNYDSKLIIQGELF